MFKCAQTLLLLGATTRFNVQSTHYYSLVAKPVLKIFNVLKHYYSLILIVLKILQLYPTYDYVIFSRQIHTISGRSGFWREKR